MPGVPTESGRPHPPTAISIGTPGIHFYPLATGGVVEPATLPLVEGTPPDEVTVASFPGLAFTPDGLTLVANTTVSPSFFSRSRPCVLHWHLAPTANGWRVLDTNPGRTQADAGAARAGDAVVLVGEFGVATCPLDPTRSDPLVVPDLGGRSAVAAPVGELVAVAVEKGITVWNLRTPRRLALLPVRTWVGVPSMAFSPDGLALAVGTTDGVAVWNPWTGARGPTFDFGVGPVESVAYAPNGLVMAVAGRRGVVVADVD
jgi:WD40 repeat protein